MGVEVGTEEGAAVRVGVGAGEGAIVGVEVGTEEGGAVGVEVGASVLVIYPKPLSIPYPTHASF